MSATALYISPHLDDVALSCAGRLLSDVAAGKRVVVATLFSEPDTARKKEDRAALEAVGAEAIHLGLADAPFRLSRPLGFESLFVGDAPTIDDVERARSAVARLRLELQPQQTWFPLGIGGHIDHRVAFECHRVVENRVVENRVVENRVVDNGAFFYLDRPYSFVEPLTHLRQLEIEGGSSELAPGALDAALGEVALLDRFFRGGERSRCVRAIERDLARVHPDGSERLVFETDHYPHRTAAAELIARYRSQRWIFGNESVDAAYRRLASDDRGRLVERTARLVNA